MKAMILCGGQGTRLREHTELTPKPMVEIGGRPILWHIMKIYAYHGIKEFILCLGYKGEMIKQYFLEYEAMNSDFTITLGKDKIVEYHSGQPEAGWRVTLVDTGEDAMTGARVKRASKYLDQGTFALTYGDGLTDADLAAILKEHQENGAIGTLMGVRPQSRYGELDHDRGLVRAFTEKPAVSQGLINGGFFFLEPAFLEYLADDDSCVLERGPLERLASEGQLRVHEHSGYWQCMDTYRDWLDLKRKWDEGAAPWVKWR